jgi:uncharacterized protein YjbI with pentapeptide repeats
VDSVQARTTILAGGDPWRALRPELTGKRGALANLDFSEANFDHRDLAEIDFTKSDFFKASFENANLKKSTFCGADLAHAKMNRAALYKADLNEAILHEADLSFADLSSSSCQNADFRGADLTGANLAGADLRGADFSHCKLNNVDLSRADVTGAKFHFAQLAEANLTHLVYGDVRKMAGLYYGVRGIDAAFGNAIFVRDAKDQDYIDTLHQSILDKEPGWVRWCDLALFRAWGLIDHGRSLLKVSIYAFVIATFYGLIYLMDMKLGWEIMDYSNSAKTWFTPFYYSVVTYTTLGFGDVTADSLFGEIFVISEVILGYFTLGLLLAILANTIARRS